MRVVVNGEERTLDEQATMDELIKMLNLKGKVMAAAVNMEIVKQETWITYQLKDGDKVELLDFVGGG
jgi:sulfur carrier protein